MSSATQSQVQSWLRKRVYLQCAGKLAVAIGLLVLGAGFLFVTYWFVIGFWYFVLVRLGVSADLAPFAAGTFIALLFIGNARTDRQYLSELSVTTGTFSDEVVTFYLPGIGMASNINPLAPDTIHSFVKIITTLLFCGPRAVVAAYRYLRTGLQLMRTQIDAVANVIGFLYSRPGRVDFQTIVANVSDLNPVKTFPQVTLIEGVLVLSNEPAGLTLGSSLRGELDQAIGSIAPKAQ